MVRKVYPRRYAQAVFEIALERGELDKWQADLGQMARLSEDTVLLTLLESPKLSFEDKIKLLAERLTGISPLAQNLAHLLIARGKMNLISGIAGAYQQLLDNYRGIQHAEVTTAVPLEDKDREKLQNTLNSITGKKVMLETKVDASIIGGMVARIDGKLLDGSTRSKLLALKKALVGAER